MPKYNVVGEYGPTGDMNITLDIEADNPGHAKNIFCETVERDHPVEWERMGRRNVSVHPYVEPKPQVVQTLWRVKFSGRSDLIVTAKTLLGAVDCAEQYCQKTGQSPDDLTSIEYLAY